MCSAFEPARWNGSLPDVRQAFLRSETVVKRALLPFAAAIATVAACSLLYNPDHLPSGDAPNPDGDPGRVTDASIEPDALSSDATAGADASRIDAAMSDAAPHDAAPRDAAIDARPIDAPSPDAPSCGATGQACCPGNTCELWNECTGGACMACGGLLQSCCDPGASCRAPGVCLLGTCG
jgi:hypothetical protein